MASFCYTVRMKPFKEAVSLVITNSVGEFLVVKRPDNPNDDIAGIWGFPAVTLHEGESSEEAAHRVGQQKLGIEIELGNKINDSTHDRGTYTLHLTDYYATVKSGNPSAPQNDTSVTQYESCKFTNDPTILFAAAQKGSQCTQIFLESKGYDWETAKLN